MIGRHFYHETIKAATAVFGSLFNNIVIKRKDGKLVPVPISYGPRAKWLEAQKAFKPEEEMFEKLLPRMSYELVAMNYDVNRKLTSKQDLIRTPDSRVKRQKIKTPVPYNLSYTLYLETKNLNDGWQIIEQILPFFQPAYTVKVRHFPADGDSDTPVPTNDFDMPIILTATTWTDDWVGEIEGRRTIEWQLEFETKVFLAGPVANTTVIFDSRAAISTPGARDSDRQNLYNLRRGDSDLVGLETGFAQAALDSDIAAAVATITAGKVTNLSLTKGGNGYDTAPTVTITRPDSDALVKFGNGARQQDSDNHQTKLNPLPQAIPTQNGQGYRLSFWIYPTSGDSSWKVIMHTPSLKIFYNGTTGIVNFAFTNTMAALAGQGLIFDQWNKVVIEHIATSARIQTNQFLSNFNVVGSSLTTFNDSEEIKVGYASASDSIADYATEGFVGALDQVTFDSITSFSQTGIPVDSENPQSGDIFGQSFDKPRAKATATIDSDTGRVNGISIDSEGRGYFTAPTVTFSRPTGTPTPNAKLDSDSGTYSPNVINLSDSDGNLIKIIRDINL